ncbi:hypothetical protein J437_LFUL012094, partial [Ladona fulva]
AKYLGHQQQEEFQQQQLTLRPLFFEVPLPEWDAPTPLFVGRMWLLESIASCLGMKLHHTSSRPPSLAASICEEMPIPSSGNMSHSKGQSLSTSTTSRHAQVQCSSQKNSSLNNDANSVVIVGGPGTGKTALLLQLVESSCFGRRRDLPDQHPCSGSHPHGADEGCHLNLVSEKLRALAYHVVAYHFCQVFLELSLEILFFMLALQGCSTCEDSNSICIILVDGLCEAEYHRPDFGPSLGSFLAAHSQRFPKWLRLVVTARTRLANTVLAKDLPYNRISLDDLATNENLQRDLVEYIHFRAHHSPTIRANLLLASPSTHPQPPTSSPNAQLNMAACGEGSAAVARFAQHLLNLSAGSFLFTKLTLDLIERGHLVTKSSSYKVLPLNVAQIFQLHFNLRFHTVRAFERVLPILSVILASLCPPTLLEVFYAVNALRVDRFLSWDEFLTRFKSLSGFVVKRLDETYMFFHPAFREWLIRREEGDSTKFLCDPRIGHLGVALRLTRLQSPLEGETLIELGHHILKAHPYRGLTLRWPLCSRDLQAAWVGGVAADPSASLASLRNAYTPNVKVSRLLLLAGASPSACADGPRGKEPLLCISSQRGDVEFSSLLLEFGADAGAEGPLGCTPLSIAASMGHERIVTALLHTRGPRAGAGRIDLEGKCPLVHAALGGHTGVISILMSSDWVMGSTDGREVSLEEASAQALVAASAEGHTELVEYLVDICGVNPNVVDGLSGESPLTAAVSHGRHSTASALLMRGASITLANSKGMPPLVAAVAGSSSAVIRPGTMCSIVELLMQVGGASMEQKDSCGRTALIHAASHGHVSLTRLLLEKGEKLFSGCSIHVEDKEGLSALGWACLRGATSTARILLDAGAQVQKADASGRTPLHLAAAAPLAQNSGASLVQASDFIINWFIVLLLLERGAVLEGVDAMGLRPLDRAVGTRNIPAVHCFLRRGARLGPATWAMAAGKPDVTLILLNKLLEDGNVLYKKGRLQEASHRYRYALKKCPTEDDACLTVEGFWSAEESEDSSPTKLRELFDSVRVHLMLNLSRCTRKLGEYVEAVKLAEGVLRLRPDSYEAHYARAKAKVDLGDMEGALSDIEEALRVVPPSNREARRVLMRVHEELQAEACPKQITSRDPCVGENVEGLLEE